MSNKGDKGKRGMIAFCPVCGSSSKKITWDPKTDTCTCTCGWSDDPDRKKQIREMACENCLHYKACLVNSEYVPSLCKAFEDKAGYRKQSEGEWRTVLQDGYIGPTEWVCSNCKEEFCIYDMPMAEFLQMMKHCPNCGAKMKGGE